MKILSVKKTEECLEVTKDDEAIWWVPEDSENSDYQEILSLVEAGELTIEVVE